MSVLKLQCMKCKHFFVTYEQATPRGCRAYGFTTASIPSSVILRETGSECLKFEPKLKSKDKPQNLNSDYFWKKSK